LDLNAFVEERRPSWRRLEHLVGLMEASGPRSLAQLPVPDKDKTPGATRAVTSARELASLYRGACADLIRARSETANAELIGYLNGLVGRAYGVIYRGRRFRLVSFLRFVLIQVPLRFRARWGYVLAATLFFLAGVGFAWVAEACDPAAKHFLLPAQYEEIEEKIEQSPAANGGTGMNPAMNAVVSSQIMTNNISVSFGAFAAGGTAGIGTAGVLFYNGVLMGDLAAIFQRHHMSDGFWALILPHGVIELTAIMIAGAAGFLVARAIVAPGDMGRRAALAAYGKEAVELAIGCALLLVPAGLIEGFITPQPGIPIPAKIGFGAATGVLLVLYFAWNEVILEQLGFLEMLHAERSKLA
jgi:uncharacterized membrane protein SpoIIM required for sporulation